MYVATLCRYKQRRRAVVHRLVYVGVVLEQQADELCAPAVARRDERRRAAVSRLVDVGAALEQQMRHDNIKGKSQYGGYQLGKYSIWWLPTWKLFNTGEFWQEACLA